MTAFAVDPEVLARTSDVLRQLSAQVRRAAPVLDAAAHLPEPAAGRGVGAAVAAMTHAWDGALAALAREFALLADDVGAGAQLYLRVEAHNAAALRGASP